MSKLTFRADDDLVDRLDGFDASKSEVLREALREYTERHGDTGGGVAAGDRLDDLLVDRIDSRLDDRLDRAGEQDINVNITLAEPSARQTPVTQPDDDRPDVNVRREPSHDGSTGNTDRTGGENTADGSGKTCTQCGETVSPSHVYCPNCGEKASHRVFCECGDELRSDWAF